MLPVGYKNIHGWCTEEKAYKLMELVMVCDPTLSVELGVFAGKSLLPIGIMSKYINPKSTVVGIDAWSIEASIKGKNSAENDKWWSKVNYKEMFEYTKSLIVKNNIDDVIEIWNDTSKNAVSKFEDNSIDLLHQDSNHSEENTCEEVELYWNKLKEGGYWIFNDTDWPTAQKAQKLLLSKGYTEHYNANDKWKVYLRNKTV